MSDRRIATPTISVEPMTVEQWSQTAMMRDAYKTVEMWKNDGSSRRILHFAILASDYGIDNVTAACILATIENEN